MQGAPREGGLSNGRQRSGAQGPAPLGGSRCCGPPPPCGKGHTTPPVGQPTRGRGVSTVGRPENPAQGATEEGARCRERRGLSLHDGRQRRRAPHPPPADHRPGVRPAATTRAHGPVPCPTHRPGVHEPAAAGAPSMTGVLPTAPACARQPRPGREACPVTTKPPRRALCSMGRGVPTDRQPLPRPGVCEPATARAPVR